MSFSPAPKPLWPALLCLMLCLTGCGSSDPAPDSQEILASRCMQVRSILDIAQKSKNLEQVKSELDINLESLQAQSNNYGNQLTELYEAVKELREKLDSVTTMNAAKPLVEEFSTRLGNLCP